MAREKFTAEDITTTHFTEPGLTLTSEADKRFEAEISSCESFDALFTLLRSRKWIPGTSRAYTPAEVIQRIDRVRNGHDVLQCVTRTFGLNNKVGELLKADPKFAKRVLKRKK